MYPEYSQLSDTNFAFAFNDSKFSDRLLRIEIVEDLPQIRRDVEDCTFPVDLYRGYKRCETSEKNFDREDGLVSVFPEEQILNSNQADVEYFGACEDQDEEAVDMVEGSHSGGQVNVLNNKMELSDEKKIMQGDNGSGIFDFSSIFCLDDEAENFNDSSCSTDGSTTMRVRTLHISSPILAVRSPFFYKLFSNGMRESEQRVVTLRIKASEEAAVMELLNFMYSHTLSDATVPALLDVLMAAKKFDVVSCMKYCGHLLRNMPMSPESALLYLELPSSVSMVQALQPLTDAAKQFLASHYKDINKPTEEVMALPLAGIEAILSSDELHVASEDAVYDFVLKWARAQYPKAEDRHQILSSRLIHFIRFPYMSCRKLRKVLVCSEFDHDIVSKLVLEALFFKAEVPHRQRAMATMELAASNHRFMERTYKYRPVKVIEFDCPWQHCIVYLDLKQEEVASLFPSGRVYSQAFHLGGQGFFLSAHCNLDQQNSFQCFGLFLGMQEKGKASFAVNYEFAVRSKPTEEYASKYKGNYTFTGGKAVGYRNLFAMPWADFMGADSEYFIDGALHLRAELKIRS